MAATAAGARAEVKAGGAAEGAAADLEGREREAAAVVREAMEMADAVVEMVAAAMAAVGVGWVEMARVGGAAVMAVTETVAAAVDLEGREREVWAAGGEKARGGAEAEGSG